MEKPPENTEEIKTCSFCGVSQDEAHEFIDADTAAICGTCVEECVEMLAAPLEDEDEPDARAPDLRIVRSGEIADDDSDTELPQSLDPVDIHRHLDEHVIGQDRAKMVLAVAIANHYKRLQHPSADIEIQKGNVLLLGPTGSGKTLLVKTVAKYLDVPFVVADATSLTQAGYVGDDVESMISMLVTAAGGDVERAQMGIIFIDEIDKLARKGENASITRDVSGEGVQQSLLKMVEGSVVRVQVQGKRKNPNDDMMAVDTRNILFIAGGAFVGLDEIVGRRTSASGIGFSARNKPTGVPDLTAVKPDDLVKFGMIPEFIGRFTTTAVIDQLSRDQLVRVLREVRNNFVSQYQYLLGIDGITLEFTGEALELMAENTLALKTGARGLHSEVERVLMPHLYHASQYSKHGITQLTVDRDSVVNPQSIQYA